MINRRITRVLLNDTEITADVSTPDSVQTTIDLTTADHIYLGFHGRFASRYIQIHTANNTASVLSAQYWDGTTWSDVDDFIDQTASGGKTLSQSGFISWVNKTNWVVRSMTGIDSDVELFWIRLSVSQDLGASTKLHSVLNIFSDDSILRAYFPELVTDTNYLPSGKTNFLQQHMAAKDLVTLRLKQRKMIQDESQIIDSNDVSVAAVYAAAMLILQPIATSPASEALFKTAQMGFDQEISKVSFAVDQDSDGIVDEEERTQSFSVGVFRR